MGSVIVCGGIIGTFIGMIIFNYLKEIGIINNIIALCYVYMLVVVGTLMFARSAKKLINIREKIVVKKKFMIITGYMVCL